MTHYAKLDGKRIKNLLHFVGKCCAMMMYRAYTLQLQELCNVTPSNRLQSAKDLSRFEYLGPIRDAHWAELIMAQC